MRRPAAAERQLSAFTIGASSAPISPCAAFIVGFPGETERDEQLLSFLKAAQLDRVGLYLLPGGGRGGQWIS